MNGSVSTIKPMYGVLNMEV